MIIYSELEQAVEQATKLPVNWDVMTLSWRHRYFVTVFFQALAPSVGAQLSVRNQVGPNPPELELYEAMTLDLDLTLTSNLSVTVFLQTPCENPRTLTLAKVKVTGVGAFTPTNEYPVADYDGAFPVSYNLVTTGYNLISLSGVPDYFYRNKISSGGDLSHYSSASLY